MAKKLTSVQAQPLIAVRDVKASSRWYQKLLKAENLDGGSDHDDVYDRIYCGDQLLLQLHSWDDEDHPNLINRKAAPVGHGVLLWFEVPDFADAVKRITALKAEVLEKPHFNPGPQHREIWIRDPDGYVVVIASPDGERER
ncbi:MAG: VOC family protein [Bdellovibrionota bacterium]